jgi:hypothetical protein
MGWKEKIGEGKNISTCWQSEFVLFALQERRATIRYTAGKIKKPGR